MRFNLIPRKLIFLALIQAMLLLSCSDNTTDSGDPDGPWLEVSISTDSFVTDDFTCVASGDLLVIGALNGVSDNGEDVQVAGQFGQDAGRQQLVLQFQTEQWEVTESDDPSESVGAFIELSVDIDNGTASGIAAVEDTYHVQSDGTDTMTFEIHC